MLNILHAFILGLVQGITEFIPVSSSAHLILFPKLLNWQDQGLAFDVAIHLGTLCAIVCYFSTEIRAMTIDWCKSITQRKNTVNSHLAWSILVGTIPVGLAGLIFHDFIAQALRATWIIAITTIGFGIILGLAVAVAKEKRNEKKLTWLDVGIIGCAQALALIPGVSRSGITLTAGLFVGLTRAAAARFSFLLSMPVIILAGGYEMVKMASSPQIIDYSAILVGFFTAAVSGYACIGFFLKFIERYGVMPFVIYRICLGILILYVL